MRLGVLTTHPIQYQAPLFRELANRLDLHVYFGQQQTPEGQAAAGFGVAFEWDVPLVDGYPHSFLHNRARRPDVSSRNGCSTPEIADIISRESFDAFLVSGWYNDSYRQAIRACWRSRTPIMVRGDSQLATPRSPAKRLIKKVVYRSLIPRFDRFLVVGRRSREYYTYYGADESRMHFSPHFVDNGWFARRAASQDAPALRRALGISPETMVLLFVGKVIPEKRPLDVIHAARRLREAGADAHVVVVGAGRMLDEMRRAANDGDVPATFVGFKNQSELPAFYATADLLVLPSISETWGLVVNEAMACGLPAIVSDQVGCMPDLIDRGLTGFDFPVGDADALAAVLLKARGMRGQPKVQRALQAKIRRYSVDEAANGVIEAMEALHDYSRERHAG